jgi:hypothetical protein
MSFRGGVSRSHRFHLGLPADLATELAGFAKVHGLGLGPSIRLLVRRGLNPELDRAVGSRESAPALAALLAAEHAVLMVASVLPEGERRMHELGQRASLAAEERLALFTSDAEVER